MTHTAHRTSATRRNLVAACVSVLSAGILYTSFDSAPAGEETALAQCLLSTTIDESFGGDDVPAPAEAIKATAEATNEVAEAPKTPETLTDFLAMENDQMQDKDVLKLCSLLLEDGRKVITTYDRYSIVFNREERIGGDMQPAQSIQMKVQHAPHFAVYMKWIAGPRGQQALYSDEYEDGYLTVKLGGIRRMLPALKINPTSALAMAESRYPITEAGVAGMIDQILEHRSADLARGKGVKCRRLKDQEINGQSCVCMSFIYEDAKYSDTYRKSLIMVDKTNHLPVMIRNYTWADGSGDINPEELDKLTLIENYSFTKLDFENELVAEDFSRSNPTYRM